VDRSDGLDRAASYALGGCCRADPRLGRTASHERHFKLSAGTRGRTFVQFAANRLVAVLESHVDAVVHGDRLSGTGSPASVVEEDFGELPACDDVHCRHPAWREANGYVPHSPPTVPAELSVLLSLTGAT
jgi:hypothetical protein